MPKAEKIVLEETRNIAGWTIVFSVIMQIIFIFCGFWNYKVFLGNVLSSSLMIFNFYLMGISVQKAVASGDEKEARKIMKLSHSLRTFLIFVVVVIGVVLPFFSTAATIIPLFFTRIAVTANSIVKNKKKAKEVSSQNESQ
ncbi:MAG: hypothetical protein E7395_00135 [Ruminococcaceae bacterium]|nr:hypothetical protein [Oscillospiraceae bacterium]